MSVCDGLGSCKPTDPDHLRTVQVRRDRQPVLDHLRQRQRLPGAALRERVMRQGPERQQVHGRRTSARRGSAWTAIAATRLAAALARPATWRVPSVIARPWPRAVPRGGRAACAAGTCGSACDGTGTSLRVRLDLGHLRGGQLHRRHRHGARKCDGKGVCTAAVITSCNGFACSGATCRTTCTSRRPVRQRQALLRGERLCGQEAPRHGLRRRRRVHQRQLRRRRLLLEQQVRHLHRLQPDHPRNLHERASRHGGHGLRGDAGFLPADHLQRLRGPAGRRRTAARVGRTWSATPAPAQPARPTRPAPHEQVQGRPDLVHERAVGVRGERKPAGRHRLRHDHLPGRQPGHAHLQRERKLQRQHRGALRVGDVQGRRKDLQRRSRTPARRTRTRPSEGPRPAEPRATVTRGTCPRAPSLVRSGAMSKRNRPRTAAEAAHRQRRHEERSAYNSPENKAARAKAVRPGRQAGRASTPPAAPRRRAEPAAAGTVARPVGAMHGGFSAVFRRGLKVRRSVTRAGT